MAQSPTHEHDPHESGSRAGRGPAGLRGAGSAEHAGTAANGSWAADTGDLARMESRHPARERSRRIRFASCWSAVSAYQSRRESGRRVQPSPYPHLQALSERKHPATPRGVCANIKRREQMTPAKPGRGGQHPRSGDPDEPTPAERRALMTWAQRLKRAFNAAGVRYRTERPGHRDDNSSLEHLPSSGSSMRLHQPVTVGRHAAWWYFYYLERERD